MGRPPRLVLLLVISLCVFHVSHSIDSQPAKDAKVAIPDEPLSNELFSDEEIDTKNAGIKISTPKVKEMPVDTTTKSAKKSVSITTKQPVSEETLQDLLEAAKHSVALAEDPRFNKMLPDRLKLENATSSKNSTEENYEYDEDDYDLYSYGSAEFDDDDDVKDTTSARPKKNKPSKTTTPKLRPIDESSSSKPKAKSGKQIDGDDKQNNIDSDSNYEDYDDDDDDDDADDDADDDDESDKLTDEEQVVFSENVPCPRYCSCSRNINSYLVATCSRLDPGTQKFGSDITDLVVTNVGPKYPILLGPKFFQQLGLKFVASIKIANCTIEYMHPEAFHGLDELYSVNMTDVGLAIINPDTFVLNKKLRMLTISGNDLSVMSTLHYLLKSSSIEELDFSRNNLMELNPSAFTKLSNIVYINLSQNNLQKIPEKVFATVDTIEELDLSYNSLKELPATVFSGTALSILHLKYNTFTGDLHFGIKELQQLDLSFNSITHVHHTMFDKMPGLTNLNLKGNGITKIQPDSFLTLKSLRHIDLSMNELDQISGMIFFKNSELDVIRLNDNPRLSQLPTDGFISYNGYFTVYYLDLSNCAIGALGHRTFSTMPHLTTLKLAWNNINNLPRATFASLTKLIDLDLSNNLITKLDELCFMENNELTKLNLAGNPITHLSVRLFMPFHQLRSLDVNDCELTSLMTDKQFGSDYKFFETLRFFNASGNLIENITVDDIKSFKNLRSLDITHNPLKCNEDFQKFIIYVSLHTKTLAKKMPLLSYLELDATTFIDVETQAGWSELAQDVCKHNGTWGEEEDSIEKRITESEKKVDEDEKKLLSVLDKSVLDKTKLSSMQKIMKGSDSAEGVKSKISDSEEEFMNNGGEEKDENENEYDEDLNDSEYDDDDDSDDDDDDDDDDNEKPIDKKKKKKNDIESDFKKYVETELKPKIKNHGLKVEEVDMTKETEDKFLLGKLGIDSDELNSDEEEIIIERGHVYYGNSNFIIPGLIVLSCLVVILLGLAKMVTLILRKRGERYRMAIMASKNSFVYQKLTEDIVKPQVSKEAKQPKVHRYAPINQV
ncbi:uncharacterized protein LOC6560515 [Drosophila grimshawi]|uniref:GH21800 n=1 Tax=Drosophila grimshawi TaxID=7222 RepID=B4J769_DROGR|nr:uncharacterized protein LOC6560515 [Drosophila grimshawi]XP_032591255.1 uncharacterized protein LOC6560515 [Drosophila grimshawi]XP_032591256.1 uncharacterized protein LOC6560515 [Drosophila grimshawi]EDW02087.1 GH21800 [Drosophila grimshawi]